MNRRGRGEDSIYFDHRGTECADPDDRLHKGCSGRWAASVSLGFGPNGKRVRKVVTGKTKTAVMDKRRALHRNLDLGIRVRANYTVADCLDDWLATRHNVPVNTREADRYMAEHARKSLGKIRLNELSARHVVAALDGMTATHSTRTIRLVRHALERAIRHAQAHDLVARNVAELVTAPNGLAGRRSKSLTLEQAAAVLEAATEFPAMNAYVVVSLLSGLRTEEVRALLWADVDLADAIVYVLRSHRSGGDTKTRKSRRGLRLPRLAHQALVQHQFVQERLRREAGPLWREQGLVFASAFGTPLLAGNVRRAFRKVLDQADGVNASEWTPRELRHTFVSILSDNGMAIEEISRLLGHKGGSVVTEQIYRQQLRPVAESGAVAMDSIFGS
jgi:integrase